MYIMATHSNNVPFWNLTDTDIEIQTNKATFWGLREPDLHILFLITYWMNGNSFSIRGEYRSIGTHHELPLEDMFRGTTWTYTDYKDAHKRLLDKGFLEERYICRRKIDWVPTEQARRAINDCLEPWEDNLRPPWADNTDEGPLFGDPNAGLLHKKGVEAAARQLRHQPWTDDGTDRPGEQPTKEPLTWYPNDDGGHACHDLHLSTIDHMNDWGIEVITKNNNRGYLVNKWEKFAQEDRHTWWIFDDRTTACMFFNELDRRDLFWLDNGRFQNSDNWSAKAINQKLWRSIENHDGHHASDLVHTVTGILGTNREKVQTLFEDYYSNN